MLEAAAAGLGVALSPYAFVEKDLAAGRLVAPLGLVPGQAQVCALTPPGKATRAARRFRDWLVVQGAATASPPDTRTGFSTS
jgi:DNA-binding transcriptional LysR family regulator